VATCSTPCDCKPAYCEFFFGLFLVSLRIDAITVQNEPLHPGHNPSMFMPAQQQATFIKRSLGPAFSAAKLDTKITLYDHNCDRPDYPLSILTDPEAAWFCGVLSEEKRGDLDGGAEGIRTPDPHNAIVGKQPLFLRKSTHQKSVSHRFPKCLWRFSKGRVCRIRFRPSLPALLLGNRRKIGPVSVKSSVNRWHRQSLTRMSQSTRSAL